MRRSSLRPRRQLWTRPQRYSARAAGPGLFVVTLPHGTDATKIRGIEVWVHTDGMEAHRVNNKTTYDEIHLVDDNPPHATIVQDNVFRSVLNGSGPNESLVTTGGAVGGGDVFVLSEGSKEFDALVSPISRGVVYARLKSNLPKSKLPQVVSMSVKLTLKR